MNQEILLDAPVTDNRYMKMFWTAHRLRPLPVRWTFRSLWARDIAYRFLSLQFKHRDQITVEKKEDRHILMTYHGTTEQPST